MRKKKREYGGRLQSWFGNDKRSLIVAAKELRKRRERGLKHYLAEVFMKGTKERRGYYVGKKHHIEGLKQRFIVKIKK